MPVCGTITADDFASGSLAAIAGGTTTVVDFATPNKGESLQFGLDTWMAKAEHQSHCDYSFHMTIDDWNADTHGSFRVIRTIGSHQAVRLA